MKKTSVFQNSLIWFGAGVSIAEILTGTYFAPLGMAKGFAAILLGHLIGCTMMFLSLIHISAAQRLPRRQWPGPLHRQGGGRSARCGRSQRTGAAAAAELS